MCSYCQEAVADYSRTRLITIQQQEVYRIQNTRATSRRCLELEEGYSYYKSIQYCLFFSKTFLVCYL